MVGLRVVLIMPILMALILSVVGDSSKHFQGQHGHGHQPPCTDNPDMFQYLPPCSHTTASTSTESSTTESTTESTTAITETTTDGLTSLERAHWCRFANGTYIPLGYSFLHTACSICQCARSRNIRCQPLQCMPTYCVDDSMPTRQSGQCCTQCAYEQSADSCVYNNLTFPHGTIIKAIEDKMQCWCQLGNIECRNYMISIFQGLDVWTVGSAVYIIVMILLVVLIFGVLLCCGCTAGFYYYYKRNQHTFQQAYDEYVSSAGWQPIEGEDETILDPAAEEKRLEAERYQFENPASAVVPPPYSAYNSSYVSEQEQK